MNDRGNRFGITIVTICLLFAGLARAQQAPTTMRATTLPGVSAAELERLGPPTTYFARVVDSSGRSVASARVQAISYSYSTTESGELITTLATDADGRFQITAIRGVGILVQAPGFGLTPARINRETAQDDPYEIHLKPPTEMHVHFVGPDGKPAVGAKVALQIIEDGNATVTLPEVLAAQYMQTTDASGEVVYPNMPQNSRINFNSVDDRYARRSTNSSQDVVILESQPLSDGGMVKLEAGGSIAGRVMVEETAKPVPGVRVYVEVVNDGRLFDGGEAVTDSDGNYIVKQLRAGNYDLYLQPDPRLSALYAAKGVGLVTLAPGQQLFGKDFTFVNGAIVRGKVTVAGTGKPLPNISVTAATIAEPPGTVGRRSGVATTGPDGAYLFHVMPGQVQVWVSADGAVVPPGLLTPQPSSQSITVTDGQSATVDFAFRVDPTPAVNGRVVDADGKPVSNVNILVEPPRNQNISGLFLTRLRGVSTKSDSEGKFTMLSVPNGTILRARKGTAGTITGATISSANRAVTLTLKDDAAGSVLLRVTQPDGTPIPSAQVSVLQRLSASNVISTVLEPGPTKNDGTRLIKSLFPDYTYTYQVSAKGFGRDSGPLQPQAGKQIELPIKLAKADSFVAGMVTDETGMPVADQLVQVSGPKSSGQIVKTDIMGHFRAEGIVPGDAVGLNTLTRTEVNGNTTLRAGERQVVPAGTDNVVLVNTPPPSPATRPGGRGAR